MELPVYNQQGEAVGAITVDDKVFGIEPHRAVIYQVMLAQQANQRRGTASTKTRGEVRGSTRKVRPQKGTGRARLGSIRAPQLRHGGIVFGPKPRSYKQKVNKRVRRLAIRSLLSDRAQSGALAVVDDAALAPAEVKTKELAQLLGKLGIEGSALLATGAVDRNLYLSARNLPQVDVRPAPYLNVLDLLNHRHLVMSVAAVRKAEELWGGEGARNGRPSRESREVA
ncbi:MAG TPA: 50S ribosomal protein L4 [Dehalococcoidia bacterium]|nr:50S ribosomal protein L4 [Dehalococcoidia bacterium]